MGADAPSTPGLEVLAFRYRLFPTPEQEGFFLQVSGCCRKVYNLALEAHEAAYAATGKGLSTYDLHKQLPGWKQAFPFLKAVPAQCLQAAIADLGDGWSRFFKGQNERPTWRRHSEAPRFRLPQPEQFQIRRLTRAGAEAAVPLGKAITARKSHKTTTRHLFLPKCGMSGKLGPVRMALHRPLDGRIRSVTITREGGLWHASFVVERKAKTLPKAQRAVQAALHHTLVHGTPPDAAARRAAGLPDTPLRVVGADRNVSRPVVCDDGRVFGTTTTTAKDLARLARLARVVAHKREAARAAHGLAPGASLKGIAKSNGLKQAEARVAKFLGRLARRRDHQAHTIARALVDGCDVLAFEDLDTKAMTATQKPDGTPSDRSSAQRRAMLDVAWGTIATYADYKARWAGKTLVRVNPAYTSQMCHACRYVAETNRDRQRFVCGACGHTDDADVNAAKNIRALGLALLGLDATGRWPVGAPDHDGAEGYAVPKMRPEGEAGAPIPNAEAKHLPAANR